MTMNRAQYFYSSQRFRMEYHGLPTPTIIGMLWSGWDEITDLQRRATQI